MQLGEYPQILIEWLSRGSVENDDRHYIRPRKWDLVISPAGLAPFGHGRITTNNLRTFGARTYAMTPKQLRTKLEPTSEPGRFIGYPAGTKGYKILLDDGRIVISRDVTFVEPGGTI